MAMMAASTDGFAMANPLQLHSECSRERHWEPKMDHPMAPMTEPAKVIVLTLHKTKETSPNVKNKMNV